MDINTCTVLTDNGIRTIAAYSHLIPIAISLFLSIYALRKTKHSKLAVIFFFFSSSVSLWLLSDVIIWTSKNYSYVTFFWSWIDYVNVIFFILGAYFFGVLARGRISILEKGLLVALSIPAFIFTVTGNSITDFYQPVCEVLNNDASVTYKVFVEWVAVASMFVSLVIAWRTSEKMKQIQITTVFVAMVLFFATFSVTEYIAAQTAIYEINLYGLFILPLFLMVMVFAITNLGVFSIRFLGTQLLVYTLLIMIGSQFLFLQSTTDAYLNAVTLLVAIVFSLLLLRNTKREVEARIQVETLAQELAQANEHQTSLIHFIAHQVKSFLTKSRYIFGELDAGTYGKLMPAVCEVVKQGLAFNTDGVNMVQNVLQASNIKTGKVTYEKKTLDFKTLVETEVAKQKKSAEEKGLALTPEIQKGDYTMTGDADQLAHAVQNLIDNAIKYTPKGNVSVSLEKKGNMIRLAVKDSGIGISEKDRANLFTEGGRGANSQKVNVDSTGYGLFIIKGIVEAHGGKVWYESEGENNGTTFVVELAGKHA